MFNKIKIYFAIFRVWFSLLFEVLKDHEFLHYSEGSVKKFKLFGKQYVKQERYQKSGRDPKSKAVTYIISLSKSFSGDADTNDAEFKKTMKYTFLWYTFQKYMQLKVEETNADSEQEGASGES